MKSFTSHQKSEGELAIRDLSAKAQEVYNGTDPLTIYRKDEGFFVRGCLGDYDNLTEKELEKFLESFWLEDDEDNIE